MSDSRITQCVAEVAAAIELLGNARDTMHQLLEEDPALPLPVQAYLRSACRELFRADLAGSAGLGQVTEADRIENRQTA